MKSYLLLTILFFGGLTHAVAQQREQSSFDHVNTFNLNNAYAGFDSCLHVFAQRKQQWTGVDGAPVNTQIQGYMPIPNGMGVGLDVSNWTAGLLRATNFSGTVAKHLQLNDRFRLGAAVSLGYYQWRFAVDDVIAFDNDNYLNQSAVTNGGGFADLGLLFSGQQFEVGVAVPSIVGSALTLDVASESNEFNVERYLNLHGTYRYQLNSELELQPMLIYRSIPGNGSVTDIKAGLRYLNMLAVNLGYRTNSGLLVAADFTWNDMFRFGYAYDAGMSRLSGISNGSHELILGYQMCKAVKKKEKEPEIVNYYAMGAVSDANSGTPLSNQVVTITNTATGGSQTITTDSAGFYEALVDSSATYSFKVENPDYEPLSESITIQPNNTKSTVNLKPEHKSLSLAGRVIDGKSNQPLSGVEVSIANGTETYQAITDNQGAFLLPLKDKKRGMAMDYIVTLKKKGYDPFEKAFKANVDNYNTIELQNVLDGGLALTPEKKPEQISEIIDLKPIGFELNSAQLTADAKLELDKVIDVLNKNPEMKIEIGAHTDCRGSESGNLRLSEKRAASTLKYIRAGISNPERIDGKGYGETQPLSNCACGDCSKEDHDSNRRTEFRIVQ